MANIGRGGVDPRNRNAAVLARLKKKKKQGEKVPATAFATPVIPKTFSDQHPSATQAPEPQQFGGLGTEALQPQQQPQTMDWNQEKFGKPIAPVIPGLVHTAGTDAANMHNLTMAFFDKWHTWPTSRQMGAMLQGASQVWSRREWYEMLKPLTSVVMKPAIADYAAYSNSLTHPAGPTTAGINTLGETGQGLQGFSITQDIINDPKSFHGKSFAFSGQDSARGASFTPDPNWDKLPDVVATMNDAARGVGKMSYAEQQYYRELSGGVIGYKQFLAAILKKNGKPVPFDPNNTDWSPDLNREFHKYLFGRLFSYATMSTDPEVQANALSVMDRIYPKIMGEGIEADPTGLSKDILEKSLKNIAKLMRDSGISDSGIINYAYNGFIDGRVPGQSEKKAMYDYVEEFGVDALPADAYKEYQDSLVTTQKLFNAVMGAPIAAGHLAEGPMGGLAERTDFIFDAWKDKPGATGFIADKLDQVYLGVVTNFNPVSAFTKGMEKFGQGIGIGITGATTAVDVLGDISMTKAQKVVWGGLVIGGPAGVASALSQKGPENKKIVELENTQWRQRKIDILNSDNTDVEKTRLLKEADAAHVNAGGPLGPLDASKMSEDLHWNQLIQWGTWVDRYHNQQATGPIDNVIGKAIVDTGLSADNPAAIALRESGKMADLYVTLKAAGAVDTLGRWGIVKGGTKVWKGFRYIEEKGRLAPDEFVEPMDLGAAPTNPNAPKPARYQNRVPEGMVGAGRLLPPGAEDMSIKTDYPEMKPSKGSNKPPTEPRGPQPRQHHVPFDRTPGEGPGEIQGPHGGAPKPRYEIGATVDSTLAQIKSGERVDSILPGEENVFFRGGKEGGRKVAEGVQWVTKDKKYASMYGEPATFNQGAEGGRGVSRYFIDPGARVFRSDYKIMPGEARAFIEAAKKAGYDVIDNHLANEHIVLNPDVLQPKSFGAKVGPGESEVRGPQPDYTQGFTRTEEMHLTDEAGSAPIGVQPETLPWGQAWGVPKEDYALFNEFAKVPEGEPITAAHIDQMMDNLRVGKTARRLIQEEIAANPGGIDNITLAGVGEMLRRAKNKAAYDGRAQGRAATKNVNPDTGHMIAFLKGERNATAWALSRLYDALDIKERGGKTQYDMTPDQMRSTIKEYEQELAQYDQQTQTLYRSPEGGMPAMIARALEIDNQIVKLMRNGSKDAMAQVQELLAEKSDILFDPEMVHDIDALGGDFRSYKTASAEPVMPETLGSLAKEYGRLTELKKDGMDVTEQMAETANRYHELRAKELEGKPAGGPYVPYSPADFNRAKGGKGVMGEGPAPGEHQRTSPPKGGASKSKTPTRADAQDLKNPAFADRPIGVAEWDVALKSGRPIQGTEMSRILAEHDGIILKTGSVKFDKSSAEFIEAQTRAAKGEPAKPEPTPAEKAAEVTNKTPQKAGKNEPPTPPEGPTTPTLPDDWEPVGSAEWVRSRWTQSVAEWIAQMTKPADNWAHSLIIKMLDLKDNPKVNNDLTRKLQATRTAADVHAIIDPLVENGTIEVSLDSPAFIRMAKVRTYDNLMDTALKMGAAGAPVVAAMRMFGSKSPLDNIIDEAGSPDAIREIGIASKMGDKKITAHTRERINYWETKMSKTVGGGNRRRVAKSFESEIKRNMGYKEKNGIDVSAADSEWAKYLNMRNKIMLARSKSFLKAVGAEKGKFIDPHHRAYGLNDTVSPRIKDIYIERTNTRNLLESAKQRGDEASADRYQKALDVADEQFDRYRTAARDFVELVDKKHRTGDEFARLQNANRVLDEMGTHQPVWAHQLTHRIEFDINHRILGWYQSGRPWQEYAKFDTKYLEKPVRLWKQWAMFGFGFPIRVYLGDELWRIPMEGESLAQVINALRATRILEGKLKGWTVLHPFTKSEKAEWGAFEERRKAGEKFSDEDQARYKELENFQKPLADEYTRTWLADKADMDFANDPSNSFDLAGPIVTVAVDADGTPRALTHLPNEPLYLPAVKHVIEKLGSDPVITSILEADRPKGGWTQASAHEYFVNLILEKGERGDAIRQILYEEDRITVPMLDRNNLRKAITTKTAETYRNINNLLDEWSSTWAKIDRDAVLRQGVKDQHISIEALDNVSPENLFSVPIVRNISSNGLPDTAFLNIPSRVYNGMRVPGTEFNVGTLPLLTWIGTKVRDSLFGFKYNEEMAKAGLKLEDYRGRPAEFLKEQGDVSRRAAQRAADFTEKTTFTRNATIMEDLLRDAVPFINSYRQFMVYWGTKMVTRPVTMAAIWQYAPEIAIGTQLGTLQAFMSGLEPFFLQPQGNGEPRDKSTEGMVKAIFQSPSVNPLYGAIAGYAIRAMTGTHADLSQVPGLRSNAFSPGGKATQFLEAFVDVPEQLRGNLFQDDTTSKSAWNSMTGRYTEVPKDSVGEDKLAVHMPFPANILQFLQDKAHVNNVNMLWQAASGTLGVSSRWEDPVTAQYDSEKIQYSKLLREGKAAEAETFLGNSKYLYWVTMAQQSADPDEILGIKQDHPELVRILAGRYTWNTNGQLLYSTEWTKAAKSAEQYKNDLRQEWLTVYGGIPLDETGRPLRSQTYGGDLNRPVALKIAKKHMAEITTYAERIAHSLAGGNKEFEQNLMDEWKRKTNETLQIDKYSRVPNAPSWYLEALKKDKRDPKDWNPRTYMTRVTDFYGKDAMGVPFKPSADAQDTILQMRDAGLLSDDAASEMLNEYSKFGPQALKEEDKLEENYRKHFIDLDEKGWYDLDSRSLGLVGFKIPNPNRMDATILKVRKAYYDYQAVGDKYGTSSREYRDARNAFYSYKDKEFLKVPGGEIFVGGLPSRLLRAPFLVDAGFHFTGDNAKQNRVLWQTFISEAKKDKPDLAKIHELKTHFNNELQDKLAAWNSQAEWYAVLGTAQYLRYVMKTSYSEYYQGPGNSVYSNAGQALVDKLGHMVQSYMKDDTKPDANTNHFKNDVKLYFGDAHSLAAKLLEWYYN